ncbi:MAG: 6,7-dimethyl-8-ribityllumazine synthase [Candidatus Diapherotrites archaeon]|nr:6,7-dimethyl-8-ribityllumazine synthase [Candidatus Diapherotrites archaeon]
MNIGIVLSKFNSEITSKSFEAAKKQAEKQEDKVIEVIEVFGAFDSPFAVQRLYFNPEIDAVIVLGAIIKGETKHDEAIAFSTLKTLQELSLTHRKPLGLGITGPGMTLNQAIERAENAGINAMKAVKMLFEEKDNIPKTPVM